MTLFLRSLTLVAAIGFGLAAAPPAAGAAVPSTTKASMVTLVSVAPDRSSISTQESNEKGVSTPGIASYSVKAGKVDLKDWQPGDFATITFEVSAAGERTLTGIAARTVTMSAKVKINSISDDRSEIILWETKPDGSVESCAKPVTLAVSGQALKDSLKNWRAKDLASITYTRVKSGAVEVFTLIDICARTAAELQDGTKKWIFWLAAFIGLVIWVWLSQWMIGKDGRYSNSKMQMALWFSIVIAAYVATLFIRGFEFGSLNIPTNLLLLSGMSAITFGGAKAITENKDKAAAVANANAPNSAAVRSVAPAPSLASDLVRDAAGDPDLGDTQMTIITIIAAAVYIAQLQGFFETIEMRSLVSLPDVDNTLLASFGLGHGAYLIKKAVGNINQ